MPTRNVNLTDELDQFILDKVKNGRYENASEVVRAALRAAIAEGEGSGIAEGDVFARLRAEIKAKAAAK